MRALPYLVFLLCCITAANAFANETGKKPDAALMAGYFEAMKRGDFAWLAERTSTSGKTQIKNLMVTLARYAEEANEFDECRKIFGDGVRTPEDVENMPYTDLFLAMIRSIVPGEAGWKDFMGTAEFRYLGSLDDGEDVRYSTFVISFPAPDGGRPLEKASILKIEREGGEWKFGFSADFERAVKPMLERFRKLAQKKNSGDPVETRPKDEANEP